MAGPLVSLVKRSLIVLPVLVNGALPLKPGMKRQTNTVAIFDARAWNSTGKIHEVIYTGVGPQCSERGASSSGPRAKPRMYVESAPVFNSLDELKRRDISIFSSVGNYVRRLDSRSPTSLSETAMLTPNVCVRLLKRTEDRGQR